MCNVDVTLKVLSQCELPTPFFFSKVEIKVRKNIFLNVQQQGLYKLNVLSSLITIDI